MTAGRLFIDNQKVIESGASCLRIFSFGFIIEILDFCENFCIFVILYTKINSYENRTNENSLFMP